MIFTLILFSALLSLVHYLELQEFLIYAIGLPVHYYVIATVFLIVARVVLALSRFFPSIRRNFRRVENLVNRFERIGANDKFDPNNQKRRFSTSSRSPLSGKSRINVGEVSSVKSASSKPRKEVSILDVVRTRFRVVNKVVSLSHKFMGTDRFRIALRTMFLLALSRTGRLAYRANSAHAFLSFILKINNKHGSKFTIKWLKAGYVAIQRELGQDGMQSLRVLDPELPLPALASRIPRIIPSADRALIRQGNPSVIRFWSSLFNLYRIFKCEGEMKISTITAPFSGDEAGLASLISQTRSTIFFNHMKGYKNWASTSLTPDRFVLSKAASPSNRTSLFGLLTDIYNMHSTRPDLWTALFNMAFATDPRHTPFMEHLVEGANLISDFKDFDKQVVGKSGREYAQADHLMTKPSVRAHGNVEAPLSQFAIKEEAAGKVRVFALVDSLSQTFLAPIHKFLFGILSQIPNDGTFDQDASVKRCQEKAIKNGCAYSYDLTAATDRVPVKLSASILSCLLMSPYLGDYWQTVMVDRDFYFNDKIAEKFKVSPGPYRYSVGQPMGGLSSWAMLAITHHWIVQLAAYNAGETNGNSFWYLEYEILGDDLVIFNRRVAEEYLKIMKILGCEINLNKSITSHNRPVFEFAKRTCFGADVVSGISFNQLLSNTTVGNRVANVLSFAKSGHLKTVGMVLSLLTRGALTHVSGLKDQISRVSLLALLGSLHKMRRVSLVELVTALIPQNGELEGQTISLPYPAVLKLSFERLIAIEPIKLSDYDIPWASPEARLDTFEEHKGYFTVQVLLENLHIAESLVKNWAKYLRGSAGKLIYPLYPIDGNYDPLLTDISSSEYFLDLPTPYQSLVYDLEEWFGATMGLGDTIEDPAELLEEAQDMLEQFQYDEALPLQSAIDFQSKLTDAKDAVLVEESEDPSHIIQSTPVVGMVRALLGLNRLKMSRSAIASFGPVSS
nr:putative RNA-dependent RNA polymerase [Binucleate Rhizoctonia mitovirus 3]